jgi:tetratricopeptide (TPR) repeat protein
MNIVDLELIIRRAALQGYEVDLRVALSDSAAPIAPLATPVPISFELDRLRALTLDPLAYGTALSTMLLASANLRTGFAQARAVAAQKAAPLRLRLTLPLDAEELHALRWETLADPEAPGQPLAVSARLLLSRTLPCPDWQPVRVRSSRTLRAVALVAAPADLPDYGLAPLSAAQEIAQLQAHLSGCAVTVLGLELRATLPALLQQLHQGVDLLLVIAHGRTVEDGQTTLYLEDEAGCTAPIAGAELVARISTLADKPGLIILGSCESAGDGDGPTLVALGPQLLRVGVPAVLGMQGRITLATLGRFLPVCLQVLVQDGQIDRAVAIARDQVRERPDWWVPALWMRATDGRLWAEPTRPASPPNAALHQLRAPVSDFVGREGVVAKLATALRTGPGGRAAAIGGVRGMGGSGKTELGLVVAHLLQSDYPDAQILLELRGVSDTPLSPEQALQQVIQAFRPEEKLPEGLSALQALYRSVLAGRRALILADDARDADQVRGLQPPPGSVLLITSRRRFLLDGMVALDLDRLDETAALHLLRRICNRLDKDQARQLAQLCGYLPLALRISASILASNPARLVARYLSQLADERQVLTALRTPDEPGRDVEATLRLSYAAVDQAIQRPFRRLGVLAADADVSLLAALLELSPAQAEVTLEQLLRHSLIEYDAARERWRIHDLVRLFALEQLAAAGEERVVRLRYAEQVIRVIGQAEQRYQAGGMKVLEGLALFDRERSHREAVRLWLWAQPPTPEVDDLIWKEAFATLHIEELRDPVRKVQVPRWTQAVAVARRRGDRRGEGWALGNLGNAFLDLGEARQAISYHKQHLAIEQEIGDRRGAGMALGNLGNAFLDLGEAHRAAAYYEQALVITREEGDRREEGLTLGNLGSAALALGEAHQAITYHEQHLAIAQEVGDRRGEGRALSNLGLAHEVLGNFTEALAYCSTALELAQKVGHRSLEGAVLRCLGNVQATFGQQDKATANYKASLVILDEVGDPLEGGRTRWAYGQFLIRQGARERGIALMAECVAYEQQIGHAKAAEHAALVEHLRAGGELPAAR